jgi:hypothetical protein
MPLIHKAIIATLFATCAISTARGQHAEDPNPFVETVARYTPAEVRQVLGRAEPESVSDLFLLLPDDLFNLDVASRRRILRAGRAGDDGTITLEKRDDANGYLCVTVAGWGFFEVFACREPGGAWSIATNTQMRIPETRTVAAGTYFWSSGELEIFTGADIAGAQDYWPEMFINFAALTGEQASTARAIYENHPSDVLYRLPQRGLAVTSYIDPQPYIDAGIPRGGVFKQIQSYIFGAREGLGPLDTEGALGELDPPQKGGVGGDFRKFLTAFLDDCWWDKNFNMMLYDRDMALNPYIDGMMDVRRYYNPGTVTRLFNRAQEFGWWGEVDYEIHKRVELPFFEGEPDGGLCDESKDRDGIYIARAGSVPGDADSETLRTYPVELPRPGAAIMKVQILQKGWIVKTFYFLETPGGWKLGFIDDSDCGA